MDLQPFHSSVNSYWLFCVKGAGEAVGEVEGVYMCVCIENSCQATDTVLLHITRDVFPGHYVEMWPIKYICDLQLFLLDGA